MFHAVVARSEQRQRRRAFLAEIEQAGDETLAVCLDRLESAEGLTRFGAWQHRAILAELEARDV